MFQILEDKQAEGDGVDTVTEENDEDLEHNNDELIYGPDNDGLEDEDDDEDDIDEPWINWYVLPRLFVYIQNVLSVMWIIICIW